MADRLRVTELDFDEIKNNLKLFLNQQPEFTDYDFEGSGLSILLDILAYNTHYNAYYLNMVANEAFLDTALLRESVVSHAKSLGYVPYSQRAPIATINFTAKSTNDTRSTLIIPAGYSFLSNQIDNTTYNFIVLEDTIATKANSEYFFENLELYEGQFLTYNFVHDDSTNPKQIFTLPDENIDTTTIKVAVAPSVSNTDIAIYSKVTDILDVTTTSEVYFLQEGRDRKFQIYFGNNVVGKKIPDGAVVTVNYVVTNATAANKANNFVATSPLIDFLSEPITDFIIEPVSAASGGSERESIDEIKFNSTTQFTTQNRLVTFKDYESYLRQNYPAIEAISVWGGEDEIPPVFGKVFISIKPKANFFLTESEKERIVKEIIKPKSIVSIDAEIRDPEFLYIIVQNYVEYDKNKTTQNADTIKNAIRNAILIYNSTSLSDFGSTLILSKLQDAVDAVNINAIRGSQTIIKLQKRIEPNLNVPKNYTINFNNELYRGTLNDRLVSSEFEVFDQFGIRRRAQLEEIAQSFTGITEIQVGNPGFGYTEPPTVRIIGDGIGATAVAKVVNGRIESISVTDRGVDYSRAIVTISGGNGFGASAVAVLDSRFGKLRTFYYDENAQKRVLNSEAGTIDYLNGIITLDNFRVLSVIEADGLIRLTTRAERGIVSSNRSTIITIDPDDSSSISTDLVVI